MLLQNFNYSEYILFVYLCVANADNQLTSPEIDVLFDKMDLKGFEDSGKNELMVSVVYKKYKSLSYEQRLLAIKEAAPFHLKEKQKGLKLLQNLNQIIKADNVISIEEQNMFSQIEMIINEMES